MKYRFSFLIVFGLFVSTGIFAQQNEINKITTSYYGIKNALFASKAEVASKNAKDLLSALKTIPTNKMSAVKKAAWNKNVGRMKQASLAISSTTDLKKQRAQLNQLSTALFNVVETFKSNEKAVYLDYCPMVNSYWISDNKAISNPYLGASMPSCGIVKKTLK